MSDTYKASDFDFLDAALNRHGGSMAKETAFLTILMGAMHADNRVRKEEIDELDALIGRVRMLHSLPEAERTQRREEIMPYMADEKLRLDRVRLACSSILTAQKGSPPTQPALEGLAVSVFAHACDIIYTDLEVTELERQFLRELVQHLALDHKVAANIVNVIGDKNAF